MPANSSPNSDRGFSIFIATLALVVSMAALLAVAFKLNDNGTQTSTAATSSMPMMSANAGVEGVSSGAAGAAEDVKLVVKSDEEHGKMGSDGNWHDAFLPADFSVKPGSMVRVTVYNYDDMPHSFTSPQLGVNATIPGGSEDKPSEITFTFRAPQKAGRIEWFCALPCDPWAMSHNGFMRGYVSVA